MKDQGKIIGLIMLIRFPLTISLAVRLISLLKKLLFFKHKVRDSRRIIRLIFPSKKMKLTVLLTTKSEEILKKIARLVFTFSLLKGGG
jgi:hypothetical protein